LMRALKQTDCAAAVTAGLTPAMNSRPGARDREICHKVRNSVALQRDMFPRLVRELAGSGVHIDVNGPDWTLWQHISASTRATQFTLIKSRTRRASSEIEHSTGAANADVLADQDRRLIKIAASDLDSIQRTCDAPTVTKPQFSSSMSYARQGVFPFARTR
jgi:hypothetical protein